MKQTRLFRPRRGIHFGRNVPHGPAGQFLGADIEVTQFTGSVQRSAVEFHLTGSKAVAHSVASFGRNLDTMFLNQRLLGLGTASLGRSQGVAVITTGSIPSWTNFKIKNSAFVVPTLSSSDHEVTTLGLYRSGTQGLESSPVPASSTLYYSKDTRYQKVIVKKTASFLDTLSGSANCEIVGNPLDFVMNYDPAASGFYPACSEFVPGTGTLCVMTGTFGLLTASVSMPAIFSVDVPTTGKLVDIKVWVELVHLSSSNGTDTLVGLPANLAIEPLAGLGIALKSPAPLFKDANPIKNDPLFEKWRHAVTDIGFTDSFYATTNGSGFPGIPLNLFHARTYILWEGGALFTNSILNTDMYVDYSRYPTFNRDRSMRVVFSDGALTPNPRHLYSVSGMSGNYLGAPNASQGRNSPWGCDVPWTSDASIETGSFAAAGSPPRGWLTGPGGTAAVNEWPTTGSNYGATEMRPMYPLLDDVYERKRGTNDSSPNSTDANAAYGDFSTGKIFLDYDKWTGFRPGLRGSEISGTWKLLVAQTKDTSYRSSKLYFRQFRLEITYESWSHDGRTRVQPKVAARKAVPKLLWSISGSDNGIKFAGLGVGKSGPGQNYFVNDVYSFAQNDTEVGRTFGIAQLTGSGPDPASALSYRVTGVLADLSGSYPGWLLNNRFGMPMIPISSASLVAASDEQIVSINPQVLLSQKTVLDGARRLSDAAQDAGPALTSVEKVALTITGSST